MKTILVTVLALALICAAYLLFNNQRQRVAIQELQSHSLNLSNILSALQRSMKESDVALQATNALLFQCSSNLHLIQMQLRSVSNQWNVTLGELKDYGNQLAQRISELRQVKNDHEKCLVLNQSMKGEISALQRALRQAQETIVKTTEEQAMTMERLKLVEVEHARLLQQWNDPYALSVREASLRKNRRAPSSGLGKLELLPDETIRIVPSPPSATLERPN